MYEYDKPGLVPSASTQSRLLYLLQIHWTWSSEDYKIVAICRPLNTPITNYLRITISNLFLRVTLYGLTRSGHWICTRKPRV